MKSIFIALTVVLLLGGCANAKLNVAERENLRIMASKGQSLVYLKEPRRAYDWAYWPGGGHFYTDHYVLGVINAIPLVVYPLSITWSREDAAHCAERFNYDATVVEFNRKKYNNPIK